MNRMLRKVVLFIMAAMVSLNFTACVRNLDITNAQEIINLLNAKYGLEFEVKTIGNRLASDKANEITAYCYPKSNDKVIFEAVMNSERELVADNYLVRCLEIEAKEIIEEKFLKNSVNATVAVSISRLPNGLELHEKNLYMIISECPDISLTFTTVIGENEDSKDVYEILVEVLKNFYSGNTAMLLGTTVWIYDDNSVKECASEINSVPSVSKTILEKYKPISTVNVAMVDGEINIDYVEFSKKF